MPGSSPGNAADLLLGPIDEALALLAAHATPRDRLADLSDPLPSLLEQCEAMCRAMAPADPPLRLLHHLAGTGGNLIAAALSLQPNTLLLAGIDPLCRLHLGDGPRAVGPFCPTDLLLALHRARQPVGNDRLATVFRAGLAALAADAAAQGQHLVVQDHAQSCFAPPADPDTRPTLREVLAGGHGLLSAVVVRHPLDALLSLEARDGGPHPAPCATMEAHARGHIAFLDRHRDLPVVRYEDFVAAPGPVLEQLCATLDLPCNPATPDLLPDLLPGPQPGAGRNGGPVAPRPRRPVPDRIRASLAESPSYYRLCDRLGYDPDPG